MIHTLHADDATFSFDPTLGGSVTGYRIGAEDILRPAAAETRNPLETACFPLVPIVNRIPDGRFEFDGRQIDLPANMAEQPDFIHGHGWLTDWSLTHIESNRAEIEYSHQPDSWPWHYTARQRFDLRPTGCRISLVVQNDDSRPMPASLGLHPYFQRDAATRLQFGSAGHWVPDAKLHPQHKRTGPLRKDWTAGDDLVDDALTDHTFFGFDGRAAIEQPGSHTIQLRASANCTHAHIYSPPGQPFFCLEPVTDRADPFGEHPRQIKILAPGEQAEIRMDLDISTHTTD